MVNEISVLLQRSIKLYDLELSNCKLTDSALLGFTQNDFQSLQYINLNYNDFTEEGIVRFATNLARNKMKDIQQIDLLGIKLSQSNFEQVKKIFTGKKIFVKS